MHAAILLLVACACNFLVWASPTAVKEPAVPAGVQQYPREDSDHSLETSWVGHAHQPRELGKRWSTQVDRRVLEIVLTEAFATAFRIARTYTFHFEYHYDSASDQLVYYYDHSQFSMRWPAPLLVGSFDNGCDLAVPAIVTAAASSLDTIVCTLIWGAKLRTDWTFITGMALFEMSLVTSTGNILRLDPIVYRGRFIPNVGP